MKGEGLVLCEATCPSRGSGGMLPRKILNYAFNFMQSGAIWEQNQARRKLLKVDRASLVPRLSLSTHKFSTRDL